MSTCIIDMIISTYIPYIYSPFFDVALINTADDSTVLRYDNMPCTAGVFVSLGDRLLEQPPFAKLGAMGERSGNENDAP
jgi:hypothetical protein